MQQTYGQKQVRLSHNPSGNTEVDEMKQKIADAIDQLKGRKNLLKVSGPEGETSEMFQLRAGPALRDIIVAEMQLRTACMWAVAALTAQP